MSLGYGAYPGKTKDIVATLKDGRVIAYSQSGPTAIPEQVETAVYIYFPDLRRVEYVLQLQFHTTGDNTYLSQTPNKWLEAANVVGLTIYANHGTTLTVDALAIGPP